MNTVICPSCGKDVEISQALRHQIEDQVLEQTELKHKQELESLKKDVEAKAFAKAKEDLALKLKDTESEALEAKERNKTLQEQLLNLTKEMRQLRQKDEDREVVMEKKLLEERSKLQEEIGKSIKQKNDLEKKDLQKQLDDTKKLLEDARRKADQRSQQLQGEVLELELEELLKNSFPDDEIIPIAKGQKGADIQLVVKTQRGSNCGSILLESKRHKDWDEKWITKLREDLRANGAVLGIIISSILPKDMTTEFSFRDGIYVTSFSYLVPILETLRQGMINVARQKFISANQTSKAEVLYEYITGHEFRQQVEALAVVYNEQLLQIGKERAAYEKMWKAREAQAQRIMLSVTGIYGTLQGKIGNSLPQIKSLELLEEGEDDQQSLLE